MDTTNFATTAQSNFAQPQAVRSPHYVLYALPNVRRFGSRPEGVRRALVREARERIQRFNEIQRLFAGRGRKAEQMVIFRHTSTTKTQLFSLYSKEKRRKTVVF